MAMHSPLGPLPNSETIRRSIETVGAELSLLRNLPQIPAQEQLVGLHQSVTGLQRSVADIQQSVAKIQQSIDGLAKSHDTLSQALTTLTTVVDTRFTEANTQLAAVEENFNTRLEVMNHNLSSRILNALVRGRTVALQSFMDSNNQLLADLPRTLTAFDLLQRNGDQLKIHLRSLGVSESEMPRRIDERFQLLGSKMGVVIL